VNIAEKVAAYNAIVEGGRKGGKKTSPAKTRACQKNAKLGGLARAANAKKGTPSTAPPYNAEYEPEKG
jgi:hypothetical protein